MSKATRLPKAGNRLFLDLLVRSLEKMTNILSYSANGGEQW